MVFYLQGPVCSGGRHACLLPSKRTALLWTSACLPSGSATAPGCPALAACLPECTAGPASADLQSIRDLLVSDAEAKQQRALQLVNSQRSGCNVPDAIQVGRRRSARK